MVAVVVSEAHVMLGEEGPTKKVIVESPLPPLIVAYPETYIEVVPVF
jgi:hypothetical protein